MPSRDPPTAKQYYYHVKLGIDGIEAIEFGSGVLYAEAPVDAGLCLVSLQFQGANPPAEGFWVQGFVGIKH